MNICITFFMLCVTGFLNAEILVYLQGTSRSGKSSICEQIQNHSQWKSFGSLYFPYTFQTIKTLFPDDFSCIQQAIKMENIGHAITKNMLLFKENTSELKRHRAQIAIQKIRLYFDDPHIHSQHMSGFVTFTLNKMIASLKEGNSVLADVSWYIPLENLAKEVHPNVVSILAYCPFNILIERISERNMLSCKEQNMFNHRFYSEPINTYLALYDLSKEDLNAIDTLDKQTLLSSLKTIELQITNNPIDVKNNQYLQEFSITHLIQLKNSLLSKFGEQDKLYVVPKIPYQLLLRTDQFSPQECAIQICQFTENFSLKKK